MVRTTAERKGFQLQHGIDFSLPPSHDLLLLLLLLLFTEAICNLLRPLLESYSYTSFSSSPAACPPDLLVANPYFHILILALNPISPTSKSIARPSLLLQDPSLLLQSPYLLLHRARSLPTINPAGALQYPVDFSCISSGIVRYLDLDSWRMFISISLQTSQIQTNTQQQKNSQFCRSSRIRFLQTFKFSSTP